MVSMKDISAACGVSVATVSKALNNHSDIGEETKEYIRKTAKEMGYFPNSAAKALKTNRTYNLGVLFVDDAQSGLKHDYFAYVLDSFKQTAEQQGYDMTFINCCKTRNNKMSYLDHARYRGFDGVVIACIDFYDPEVMDLVRSDIPVVTIDHLFNNRIAIISDNVKGMRDLLTFVYNKGHRKIAYIHGMDSAVTQSRLSSFYKTAQELELEIPDEYIKEAAYRDTKATFEKTQELLDLPNPPTCILYPDDFASFGGINAIKERGLSIPQDISVVGYDGIRIGRHLEPQLTTLRQDTELVGAKAAECLIDLIEHPKTTLIQQVVVEGEVFEGKSVGTIN
ncbi:LacI family DNA-binding transcriptional regulator [Kineothrix sp. MB12-C1]|uniref:LacI family DNA-binding transcriptional regulator n=1 Tax=Kineothrix sp. MB12-C1 TaxID=3070215 RepID=UPI0027D3507B|nr:LacI family DNA-binding transcriptional regulator [Kineothrix sp. MB12-C1]WMC93669.1 LacI family DNA-binding transcriptional regulator [Kineothrix sp. MB12-C1]